MKTLSWHQTALAVALWALAGAALAQPLVPTGEALEAALKGVWCSSKDGGETCWAQDEFHGGGVITSCGQFPGATLPYTASARYRIEGTQACYEITAARGTFGLESGARFCTEVIEVNERLQRYRSVDTGEVYTQYRRPGGTKRCPGNEARSTPAPSDARGTAHAAQTRRPNPPIKSPT